LHRPRCRRRATRRRSTSVPGGGGDAQRRRAGVRHAHGFAAGPEGELDFIEQSSTADPASGEFVDDQLAFLRTVDTILLGSATYRMFSAFWPEQTVETQGISDALNSTPKIVFSGTLESAPWGDWEDARVVRGSASDEIRRLREEAGKDMVVWGSLALAESLMRDDLVDEYRLWTCPVVLGSGRRLFVDGLDERRLTLVETKTYDDGVVAARYARA
jgi:dihydrofolate reductase